MTEPSIAAPSDGSPDLYDPFSHTPDDRLYDVYAELRTTHPVYYNERRRVWCLSRYADVQRAARDWKVFATAPGVDLDLPNYYGPGSFLDLDPPRHDVLRDVVRPFFTPKAINALAVDVGTRVEAIMAALREREEVDLAAELAWQLPIWTISRLLGTPEEDDAIVRRLVIGAEVRRPGDEAVPGQALSALAQLRDYLLDLFEHKRRHPDDRILSRLVSGVADGAPNADELVGMASILFVAGTETTVSLLGNAMVLLSEHPPALNVLRSDATDQRLDQAIDEMLRYESPVQYLARTVTQPASICGVEIGEGERVLLMWGAANRDPERWERPDEFDIDREQHRHVGFGEGIHFCIGAPLARLEARIALRAFLGTFADYEIREKERMTSHVLRGWHRLQATLIPHASSTIGGSK